MSRQRNRKPVHPGKVFRLDVLEPVGVNLTEAADALGVSRKHLSSFVNEHVGCSADLAMRIAKATDTSVESWLNLQQAYDVWEKQRAADTEYASVRRLADVAA